MIIGRLDKTPEQLILEPIGNKQERVKDMATALLEALKDFENEVMKTDVKTVESKIDVYHATSAVEVKSNLLTMLDAIKIYKKNIEALEVAFRPF